MPRVGAHHQAVDHYRRALRYETLTSAPARIELSEALPYEHYLTGDIAAAQAVRRSALELASRVSDRQGVGRNTRWLSRLAWFVSDGEEALRRADEAIAVLEPLPESEELAMAFSNRSQIAMLREDYVGCLAWGAKSHWRVHMPRYIVQRTFTDGLHVPISAEGAQANEKVIANNMEERVTWVQTFVSTDKKATFCVYDAPTPEAVRRAGQRNGLPVDRITEVRVLEPYFYF